MVRRYVVNWMAFGTCTFIVIQVFIFRSHDDIAHIQTDIRYVEHGNSYSNSGMTSHLLSNLGVSPDAESRHHSNLVSSKIIILTTDSWNSRLVSTETILYTPFNITEPSFISEQCRKLFYKKDENVQFIGAASDEKLIGRIYTVVNGTYQLPHDCGYRSDVNFTLENRHAPHAHWFHALVPMIIPDGHTFQHFLDGTLPKLIQALHVIQMPHVKILMRKPRDKIVYEFLTKLNITKDKLVYYSENNAYGADRLYFTCNTPPLHPFLWQRAGSIFGVPNTLPFAWKDGKIVIVTRVGCHNCGRKLLNTASLITTLEHRYGNGPVYVYNGPYNLEDTVKLFGEARVVIGTHGGGMYTINFCPMGTTVIEIMPTYEDGNVIAAASTIIWAQAVLLEQHYWRLAASPVNSRGDVNVNISNVEQILDVADKYDGAY